ncbi:hypothetical protein [Pseudazoarcus pumilus]|uniref:Uncharacterized protein n=1 Tax=Pseudazoarcus pumilus TaxID=2067960 RepID=A0A2I6S6X2_9RHOO|nr:hypothetical protein [Pseudazoarcus pumilus]AUN94981.1 hypothetical protein C0099_08560 [Pseudazoarcus pumilus]
MPITIPDKIIAEAQRWELRYCQGQCSLFDAIWYHMHLGVPVPQLLFDAFSHAQMEYQEGKFSDLAEPFGVAMTKREKNRWKRVPDLSNIRFHVDGASQKGFPKTNPSYYENTAFHQVAELTGLSPQHIFDLYYKAR